MSKDTIPLTALGLGLAFLASIGLLAIVGLATALEAMEELGLPEDE